MNTLKFRNRRGKIARLPSHLRHELNVRLEDGEPGPALLAWLNGLPEVQAVLAAQFGGRPIRQQNLSEWRLGGWQDWMQEQNAVEAAGRIPEETQEILVPDGAGRPSLAETLTHWLCLRYVMATRRINEAQGDCHWRLLREFTHDVIRIQRAQINTSRLARQREYDQLYRPNPSPPAPKPNPPHPSKPANTQTSNPTKSTSTPAAIPHTGDSPHSKPPVTRIPSATKSASTPATTTTRPIQSTNTPIPTATHPTQSTTQWPVSPAPHRPRPLESQMSPAELQTSYPLSGSPFTLGHLPKPA